MTNNRKTRIQRIISPRILKFLLGGGCAALLNLLLIYCLINILGFDTPILRNLANIISIEISLVASFFIYRIWVWPGGRWGFNRVFLEQLPLYHLSGGGVVLLRVFVLFPLLDWLGINYAVNTFIGIIAGAAINYILSDRLVFNSSKSSTSAEISDRLGSKQQGESLYPPEGLGPALEIGRYLQNHDRSPSKSLDKLSVVIPAYNEEDCILSTLESITKELSQEKINYEILVVNDNSRDQTESLLKQASTRNSNIRYLNNYYPNGFGFAVRCGLENFAGDAVVIVMADGSDSPEDIVCYYRKLQEGFDCIFGSRFVKGGKVFDYPFHKLVINRLANLFIQIIFGLKYNDVTNAFKIYRREVIQGTFPLISHHFNLTVEIPLKAIVRGYSYSTLPITWKNRQTGISKLKIKEMGSRYLFIVLYIWLERHLSRGDYHRSKRRKVANING